MYPCKILSFGIRSAEPRPRGETMSLIDVLIVLVDG